MKILHVLYSGLGGHANIFFSFIEADMFRQFEYTALFNGVEVVKEEYLEKCKAYNIKTFYVSKKTGIDISYYRKLYKIMKKDNADIIFLHSSAYVLPAKLAAWTSKTKKKIIVRETQANQLKTKMDNTWLSIALLAADKIVFLSEEYKMEVQRSKWLFPEKKIAVIPNGINLDVFQPALKTPSQTFTIGMQSRIVKIKDHTTLLRSFTLLKKQESQFGKKFKLKIAGEGNFLSDLKAQAEELEISNDVEFTGTLDEKQLPAFLQGLDIYVHASLGETMSTAIMQAMACGLPVIASDVKGINNMIQNNKTGILVPPLDAPALAEALSSLVNDPALSKELAGNALEYAGNNFSNSTMFKRYKTLFNFENSTLNIYKSDLRR